MISKSKLLVILAVCCLTNVGFLFQSCEKSDFQLNEIDYSDSQYELILKKQINGLIEKSGKLNSSFVALHGFPLWGKAKWVNTKSGKMFVVPLMSSFKSKKHLIGIIKNNNIVPVISEYSDIDPTSKKLYSIHNRVMYDSKKGLIPMVRLKSANVEGDEVDLEGLLTDECGSAEDLFEASNTDCEYQPDENFGTISICTGNTDGESSASWDIGGHAWVEIETYSGENVTFSLWNGEEGFEYHTNWETDFLTSASMTTTISYSQFQNILNYNGDCSNLDWQATNTCASYSIGVWNAATESSLDFGYIDTPEELHNFITESDHD